MRSPSQGPYSRDYGWVAPTVALLVIVALTVLSIYHAVAIGRDPVGDDCTSFEVHAC